MVFQAIQTTGIQRQQEHCVNVVHK